MPPKTKSSRQRYEETQQLNPKPKSYDVSPLIGHVATNTIHLHVAVCRPQKIHEHRTKPFDDKTFNVKYLMHDSEGDHYHIPCLEFGSYFTYIDVYLNDELLMEGDVGKYTPKIDDIHETKTIQVKDDEEKVISYDYTTRGYFTLDTTLCVERSITGQKVKGSFFKKETVTTYSHVAIPYKIVYYFDSTEICTKTGLIDLGDELVYDYTIDVDPSCESQLKHYVKEWQKWSKKKKRAQ